MAFTNSKLVNYKQISPNKDVNRNHIIDTISIHCMAGNLSVEACGNLFSRTATDASSNYGIGSDGRIALYVEEKDRSWCTSSASNDNRAVTIEVANDGGAPEWHVSAAAMKSLINLCADICKRNGIKELKWRADKSLIGQVDKQNMTVHRWFAQKACPGEYLYNKHTYIALEVNKKLKGTTSSVPDIAKPYLAKGYEGIEVAYLQQDLNYLGFKDSTGKALDTDGIFGGGTEYALKTFQKKYKLTADGEYGNASYNQMKKVCVKKTTITTKPATPAKKKAPIVAKPYLEQGYSNAQVGYLQQDLNYLGFKDNSNKTLIVDKIFGAATAQALKKFQKKYKLAVDGEYGNASYAQMKKVCK